MGMGNVQRPGGPGKGGRGRQGMPQTAGYQGLMDKYRPAPQRRGYGDFRLPAGGGYGPSPGIPMAHGGAAPPLQGMANNLAQQGRYGDSMLVHMNPAEVQGIAALSPTGQLTTNPVTGQQEAFLPMLLPLLGSVGMGTLAASGALGAGMLAAPWLAGGLGGFAGSLASGKGFKESLAQGILAAAGTKILGGGSDFGMADKALADVTKEVGAAQATKAGVSEALLGQQTAAQTALADVTQGLVAKPSFGATALGKLGGDKAGATLAAMGKEAMTAGSILPAGIAAGQLGYYKRQDAMNRLAEQQGRDDEEERKRWEGLMQEGFQQSYADYPQYANRGGIVSIDPAKYDRRRNGFNALAGNPVLMQAGGGAPSLQDILGEVYGPTGGQPPAGPPPGELGEIIGSAGQAGSSPALRQARLRGPRTITPEELAAAGRPGFGREISYFSPRRAAVGSDADTEGGGTGGGAGGTGGGTGGTGASTVAMQTNREQRRELDARRDAATGAERSRLATQIRALDDAYLAGGVDAGQQMAADYPGMEFDPGSSITPQPMAGMGGRFGGFGGKGGYFNPEWMGGGAGADQQIAADYPGMGENQAANSAAATASDFVEGDGAKAGAGAGAGAGATSPQTFTDPTTGVEIPMPSGGEGPLPPSAAPPPPPGPPVPPVAPPSSMGGYQALIDRYTKQYQPDAAAPPPAAPPPDAVAPPPPAPPPPPVKGSPPSPMPPAAMPPGPAAGSPPMSGPGFGYQDLIKQYMQPAETVTPPMPPPVAAPAPPPPPVAAPPGPAAEPPPLVAPPPPVAAPPGPAAEPPPLVAPPPPVAAPAPPPVPVAPPQGGVGKGGTWPGMTPTGAASPPPPPPPPAAGPELTPEQAAALARAQQMASWGGFGFQEGGITDLPLEGAPDQQAAMAPPPAGMMPPEAPMGMEAPMGTEGSMQNQAVDQLIEQTMMAVLGELPPEQAEIVIAEFIDQFGEEAFQMLREQALQMAAPGAQTTGLIEGQGGGMDDQIPGMIGSQQPVAVSPGEFIVPADVVSGLGDGSSDAGAAKLDGMMDEVRMAKTGGIMQPRRISNTVLPV